MFGGVCFNLVSHPYLIPIINASKKYLFQDNFIIRYWVFFFCLLLIILIFPCSISALINYTFLLSRNKELVVNQWFELGIKRHLDVLQRLLFPLFLKFVCAMSAADTDMSAFGLEINDSDLDYLIGFILLSGQRKS